MNRTQPITLLICALGGEGGGVLTEWLVDTARHAGYAAQSTSIPGVAQRTGATTYYVEVFPMPLAELDGRRPVFSLSPVPGALDAIVSSELLETTRQIGNGMSAAQRTLVISSSARTLTTAERMQPGDGRADAQRLLEVVKAFSRAHHVFDMGAAAREAGTVVSAVMLGAIAGSGLFPFPREAYERVVRGGDAGAPEKIGKMAAASLRGFAAAFDAVNTPREQAAMVSRLLDTSADESARPRPLPPAVAAQFPAPVHDLLALGHARVLDYQDADYAALYVERLARVLAAERAADPAAAEGFATTREMARWLALWMAFDDIVRVAELKSRASRAQRVRGEVRAGEHDIVRVYDHFKPGAPEFAALLPAALAHRVTAWDRRRATPWAMPLKIGSHSVAGMTALRLLASLRWLRRRGSRFAEEQALIDRWLDAVVAGTRADWRLGHEVALCGRLIKGYGSTNERGKSNLLHVIDHLATAPLSDGSPAARATAIAAAREAALADEAGNALDAALVRHGAPPRPVKAQPIRWMKRPPQSAAGHRT
ncbi:indolepyruvate oxidoreductase subunit beta family protein [Variovorax saccharolyticus]|uniref:indolepyruvate oxidoreductase subunit beta family protein n=1 Tax=Variovorax saccharolyticus TaxID=3053516 RepID=UPI00257809EA|nr:indolepyruvate oxidoreductase subunit beta family protein [Variovorax sp. J22R187]MDM0018290.1 indolepyruvate oxidoreductase subunit beta family protein [Variovorax sp. J22R187]